MNGTASGKAASSEPLSIAVVETVADHRDVEPLDLDPLYESIDPDALDALVGSVDGSSRVPVQIEFEYGGCTVTVTSDGEVGATAQT